MDQCFTNLKDTCVLQNNMIIYLLDTLLPSIVPFIRYILNDCSRMPVYVVLSFNPRYSQWYTITVQIYSKSFSTDWHVFFLALNHLTRSIRLGLWFGHYTPNIAWIHDRSLLYFCYPRTSNFVNTNHVPYIPLVVFCY